jgi:hypothetical protein
MKPAMRKLYLPGGGSFDLPLPSGISAISGTGPAPARSLWIPVTVGAAVGGIVAWGIFKLWR